ncbi:hypothetical protein G6O69_16325 [Pseudenhygromyxa sp. WMMC2535]|uniref:hypothetical protein n=1 Tax=Pseudenhygromyxa sp. WMMC2535 TaxID=2712867 RepID=UPI001551A417|nr:hypothetical protein [Pseudenhygromyxa sp. WMMC2535]NVB39410.1 hypothetical protein [Pseudenhygromyxa sp. WMMC2535]
MQLAALEARIDELVLDLACYSGHRTLWLDDRGEIIHSEPDDLLETRGYSYIATLFQPEREELTTAILMLVPVELDEPVRRAVSDWDTPASAMPAFA